MMERTAFRYELGQTLRCNITGFVGVVTSRSDWLYNCNTYGLRSVELRDGKPMDLVWFDEDQVSLQPHRKNVPAGRPTGGPTTAVQQTNR